MLPPRRYENYVRGDISGQMPSEDMKYAIPSFTCPKRDAMPMHVHDRLDLAIAGTIYEIKYI